MHDDARLADQNTRSKITATALELFANQGYHKTSINQIAKTVGVSKSLIYNYFDSKDHLLAHIIDDFTEKSMKMLPEGSIEKLETPDDLLDYLHVLMADVKSQPAYYRLLIMLTLQGTVKELIMADILEKQKTLIPQLQGFFEKFHPDNSKTITYLFGAFMDGIILHYLYMEGNYPIDDVFDFFTTRLKLFLQP